jgi:hypothetical protein
LAAIPDGRTRCRIPNHQVDHRLAATALFNKISGEEVESNAYVAA